MVLNVSIASCVPCCMSDCALCISSVNRQEVECSPSINKLRAHTSVGDDLLTIYSELSEYVSNYKILLYVNIWCHLYNKTVNET